MYNPASGVVWCDLSELDSLDNNQVVWSKTHLFVELDTECDWAILPRVLKIAEKCNRRLWIYNPKKYGDASIIIKDLNSQYQ